MSNFKCLNFEMRDSVAHLTLNRPEAANALNLELAQELEEVSLRCNEDTDVRAVSGHSARATGRTIASMYAMPLTAAGLRQAQ